MFPTQFTGASFTWERKEFSKIVQRISTANSNKSLPNIEFEDIDSEIGTLNKSTSQLYKRKKGILFEKNNILFGKLRPYLKKWFLADFSGIAVGDFWVLKPSDNQARFVYYLIQTSSFYNVSNITSGTKMPRSDWKLVSKTKFYIPMKLSEKHKLGMILYLIDKLINLHERKCEELALIKKALLQKLFPKKDEFKPEVRYKNFSDTWEQRKFFDNIEKVIDFRGRTPKKLGMEWSAEGYTALSALNVKDGYIDFTADVHYANQDLYDKWMAGNDLYKGQVLFTTEAPMGNVAQVPDNRKYVLSQRTIAFNVDETKVTNDFLAVLLRSQNVQHTLKSLASGGTAQGVSQKSLSQLKVILPINSKEQQEIGNFFNYFDSLIALHQRKLEKLKQLKKFLLQNMFI